MYVFNLRLSFRPRRLSVRKILAYGLPGGPTFIETFSGFENSSMALKMVIFGVSFRTFLKPLLKGV
jgi:hypothetical protein